MSHITGSLSVTQDPDDPYLLTLNLPLTVHLGEMGDGRVIVVPAGFITDGPSIPRVLWTFLPVWGRGSRAGVVHDYLCCLLALGKPHPLAKTRDEADRIFDELNHVLKVHPLACAALYAGVLIGTTFVIQTTMHISNKKLAAMKALDLSWENVVGV